MNKISYRNQNNKESVNVNCFSCIMLAFRNTSLSVFSANRRFFVPLYQASICNMYALSAAIRRERPKCSVTCGTEQWRIQTFRLRGGTKVDFGARIEDPPMVKKLWAYVWHIYYLTTVDQQHAALWWKLVKININKVIIKSPFSYYTSKFSKGWLKKHTFTVAIKTTHRAKKITTVQWYCDMVKIEECQTYLKLKYHR